MLHAFVRKFCHHSVLCLIWGAVGIAAIRNSVCMQMSSICHFTFYNVVQWELVKKFLFFAIDYTEKQCSSAFWNRELEGELKELGNLDFYVFLNQVSFRNKLW